MPDSSGTSNSALPDSWSSNAYKASSSFVPLLTTKVTRWLAPQAHQRILDLGCGDGVLTATLKPLCAHIVAIDSSPNLLAAARQDYGHIEGIEWVLRDCCDLDEYEAPTGSSKPGIGGFDQVFSNAALHWILRDPSTRLSTLRNAYRLLEPGGTFVFEMGGPGNVAEIHAALLSALLHRGIPTAAAREACPWYFPSEVEMKKLLEGVGFAVDKAEVEYRPTRLTEGVEGGGLAGWVRLHGDSFLRAVPVSDRDSVVQEVCDVLDSVIGRDGGEGGKWVGYVRLRVLARKSSDPQ